MDGRRSPQLLLLANHDGQPEQFTALWRLLLARTLYTQYITIPYNTLEVQRYFQNTHALIQGGKRSTATWDARLHDGHFEQLLSAASIK